MSNITVKPEQYIDLDGKILIKYSYSDGYVEYFNSKNQYHRLDGPSRYYYPIFRFNYHQNGELHRIGGPAFCDGIERYEWYIYGKRIKVYYIYG